MLKNTRPRIIYIYIFNYMNGLILPPCVMKLEWQPISDYMIEHIGYNTGLIRVYVQVMLVYFNILVLS